MSARTVERSDILMLSGEALRRAMQTDPRFSYAATLELAGCYRGLVRSLKNQKLRTGLERLANWLILRDAQTGGTGRFDFPFDKKVLASRLGMAPEVLSRSFAALVAYKVTVQGPSVVIHDPQALHKLAQPSAMIDDPLA